MLNCGQHTGQLQNVRAAETFNVSHRPDGNNADVLAPTHAWITANASRSTTECTCLRDLESSHRPNGKLTFCSLLAGRWCRSPGWHSDHLIVHHQWEHSWPCARSSSKVPNAPMGKLLTCLPRLTLAQLRTLRSTTVFCTCRRDLENFPLPPWESC